MKKIFVTLCAVATLAACTTETDIGGGSISSNGEITIAASATRATDTSFEDDDQIGLSATKTTSGEEWLTNAQLDYSEGIFTSGQYWYMNSSETSTFVAYYPYSADGVPTEFTVKSDQSTEANYTASDLMFSTAADIEPTANAVDMVFQHKLSTMAITLITDYEVESVKLVGVNSTATIDVEKQSVAVKEDSAADITTKYSEGVYYAIVVPQTAVFNFEVTVEGEEEPVEVYTLESTLESGMEHALTLYVIKGVDPGATIMWAEDYSGNYMLADGSVTMDVTLNDAEGYTTEWFSSDEKVATVDNGVVTFVSYGETTITAKLKDESKLEDDGSDDDKYVSTEITLPAGWWIETYDTAGSSFSTSSSSYTHADFLFGCGSSNTNTPSGEGYMTITTGSGSKDGQSKAVTVDGVDHTFTKYQRSDIYCFNKAACTINANTYPYLVFHIDDNIANGNAYYQEIGINITYSDGDTTNKREIYSNSDYYNSAITTSVIYLDDDSMLLIYDMSSFGKDPISTNLTDYSCETLTNFTFNYFMYGYTVETTVGEVTYPAMENFDFKIYAVQTFASMDEITAYIAAENLTEKQ